MRHPNANASPPLEGFLPEQFDRADGLGGSLAGDLLVDLEMDAILADLFGRDQVGRAGVELAELAHTGVVSLFGAGADRQELEIIGEGIKDGVRGTFLICMALSIER